jgi:transcriptional regulator with XRE-family HTH domain
LEIMNKGEQGWTPMNTTEHDYWRPLSPNQVVAYNLARAREARGWSQEEAGRRLEPYLGTAWSKATFSQAERSLDPGRSRGFTADEIVAFSRCFGYPVTWFFLPPPPGQADVPRRAETGETRREYGRRLNRLLTGLLGTYEQVDDLQERIATFVDELTPKNLAEANDIVAEVSGVLVPERPFSASGDLKRWREALLAIAEGLEVIEAEVERRAAVRRSDPERWPDGAEQSEGFDIRTVDLGLEPAAGRRPPSPRRRHEVGLESEP